MPARRNIDWDLELLGVENDRVIAERLGVSPTSVLYQRRKRGIAACDEKRRHPKYTDWDSVHDLGVSSDREIAKRLGVPTANVKSARTTRGLRASWRDRSADREHAVKLRRDGWTYADIGDVLGVSTSTACSWTRRRGAA